MPEGTEETKVIPLIAVAAKVVIGTFTAGVGVGVVSGAALHRNMPRATDTALNGIKGAVGIACAGVGRACLGMAEVMRQK